ncbi:MAG TPA: DNA-binding protein [Bacteroidetes bacterium]|jgi:cold shock CspA family protein|nr:DNA-binding protein [Bacteroidota bacterium]
MSKSQETYSKKEKEKKRQKKKKEKDEKRMERKASSKGGGLDNMIAYIDENGNISDTPPDPDKKVEFELEDIVTSVPKQEEFDMDTSRQGKIDFFNTEKGFGFIKEIGTNESYFVHYKGLVDDVVEGDKVSFELEKGMKGLNAVKVTKI